MHRALPLVALLSILGCREKAPDLDEDGYDDTVDCNDEDPDVNPMADEVCDGVDNDCDEVVDEDDALDASTWYLDADGDGYGDAWETTIACEPPSNYVGDDTDCDDRDAAYHPGATEDDCTDPNDYNCDGSSGYEDADADGWPACEDCNDAVATINPAALEVCDDVDNDCDGTVDGPESVDALTWFADTDADGFGDPDSTTEDCTLPEGYTDDDTDCDDGVATTFPGADEVCNLVDDDCDGEVDEDAVDASTWYQDADGDGYGGSTFTMAECEQPEGFVDNAEDCDDLDGASYPGGTEVCDDADNDCNGTVDDDATDAVTTYADADGDGYGDADTSTTSCDVPTGYVYDATDCDDDDATSHPGGVEVCDDADNDCDGSSDEDAVDASTWYADGDSDGYGDAADTQEDCDQPSGYVADATDCDDDEAEANPGEAEVCDDIDNDCDGTVDDGATDADTWYLDADGDGYGEARYSQDACEQPSGYVDNADDCDDVDATSYPGGTEVCDDADNDCDGTTDEDDATDVATWYADFDGDGYGDASTTDIDCDQPSGYVADDTDCDDTDADISPADDEVCDGADNDCDGTVDEDDATDASTWYADMDGDSYGNSRFTSTACEAPTGYVADDTDCDDLDDAVNPGETESCNGVDDDCSGVIDDDGVLGSGEDCPAESCLEALKYGASTDGTYTLEESAGTYEVSCDMTTDGGGWTNIDSALLYDRDWVDFDLSGAPTSGTYSYTVGWRTTSSFWLNPNSSSCNTMALRATATLPFTFTEWEGEWSARGLYSGYSNADDEHDDLDWGEVTTDCTGHLKFGTDVDDNKVGNDWGANWNYTGYGYALYRTWSWSVETVTETDTMRWETVDQGSYEEVDFYGIDIWVR